MIDFILIAITLIVAITGILWKNPSKPVMFVLISLALVSSIGSAIKSVQDDKDKQFMQTALVLNLSPSPSDFKRINADISQVLKKKYQLNIVDQEHSADGWALFLGEKSDSYTSAAVFDRADIAHVFANVIAGRSSEKLIDDMMSHVYDVTDPDDDLDNRVALLAQGVFANRYRYGSDSYFYSTDKGVSLYYKMNDKSKTLAIDNSELVPFKGQNAHDLFISVAKLVDDKLVAAEKAEDPSQSVH